MRADVGGVLERLYHTLNKREYVHPDPLEFLYLYEEPCDREIVGLVSSSLAYGRVAQILKSVDSALERLGEHPADFLRGSSRANLERSFAGFRHRFTTGSDMARMLDGARAAITEYGSLGELFAELVKDDEPTVLPALTRFVSVVTGPLGGESCPLPAPELGSACKRLHLYLRWMVRSDEVDPGGWEGVPASKLLVPLDTHMHRLSRRLGLTERKQADARTALEITEAFRLLSPDDPVKYDFALTRLGIRNDLNAEAMLFGE